MIYDVPKLTHHRCAGCRHWDEGGVRSYVERSYLAGRGFGVCLAITDDDEQPRPTLAVTVVESDPYYTGYLWTRPTFGCVLWQPPATPSDATLAEFEDYRASLD
jgi:hypothetical protein